MRFDFYDIARRAETGPLMLSDDFNLKLLPQVIMEEMKDLKIEYNPEVLVSDDNTLSDEVWEAGYRVFLRTGLYSINSRRQILFSEDETKEVLKHYKPHIKVGKGRDEITLYNRGVEDSRPPIVFGGPMNADVTEDLMVKLNEAFAREKIIDVLFMPGHIRTMDGVEIRMNSGLEVKAVLKYARAGREAVSRAGRPGMGIVGLGTMGHNEIAASNEAWGLRTCDPRAVLFIAENGLEDLGFARLAHFHEYGCPIYIAFTPLIGGYAGGPAGTAVLAVASHLCAVMLGATILHMGPQHIKYGQQTNKHSLWLASVAKSAVARNSNFVSLTSHTCTGRPGLRQYWYEMANLIMSDVPNGSHICGPRPAMPVRLNHVSPLTGRWFGEMGHAAAKMNRKQAQEVVKEIYTRYKDTLEFDKVELGNTFEEVFDTETLLPTDAHYKQYREVYQELKDLGVPLE